MAAPPVPWRTVWITGAGSGIGRAVALRLAANGATVAASARSEDALDALATDGDAISAFPVDVVETGHVADTVDRIERQFGEIDLAILAAGTWTQVTPVRGIDPEVFRRAMDVNYLGTVNALAALVPRMVARGRGHIAIVASMAGYRGLPTAAAYGPTKAALINLAESIRPELEARGVRVSVINPGFVRTPMTDVNRFPMPFLMEPEDAARRIVAGLEAGRYEIAFPTRFALIMKLLRLLPDGVFFLAARMLGSPK
jgi:NAD(P)-dependent dehydrogenase (short-subunit alcohol dehydrogenase family)